MTQLGAQGALSDLDLISVYQYLKGGCQEEGPGSALWC